MKKILTLFACLSFTFCLSIQEARAQSGMVTPTTQFWNTDVTVEVNTMANQRHVRIAAGYNGWVYAAYIVNDSVSHKGGVVVRYSKDGGVTWMPFNNYPYYDHSFYNACDIVAEGLDSAHSNVFVAMSRKDLITKKFEVEVLRFNPYHIAYPSVPVFFKQLDSNQVFNLALASDFRNPVARDSVYSMGLLYNHHGPMMDSLFFATTEKKLDSVNVHGSVSKGGNFFRAPRLISTAKHLRGLGLSYSYSATSVRGTFHAVWESLDTTTSKFGHVLASRTALRTDSAWTKPVYIDSMNVAFRDGIRNPTIASQSSILDNDSTNATTLVAFEWAKGGNPDSLDLYGFINKRADTTEYWNQYGIAGSVHKEMQPDLSFDPFNKQFLLTYFDSTAQSLIYETLPMAAPAPFGFSVVSGQYNVTTSNLVAPWPQVIINPKLYAPSPAVQQPFFAWVSDPANKNGVVKCNGQYLNVGIQEIELAGMQVLNPFPNPASDQVSLPVVSNRETDLNLSILNLLGENVIVSRQIHLTEGMQMIDLNVANLSSGLYFCRLESGKSSKTVRIVVQH